MSFSSAFGDLSENMTLLSLHDSGEGTKKST